MLIHNVLDVEKVISKMAKKINEIKSEKIEIDAKLNNINKKINENNVELKNYKNKV